MIRCGKWKHFTRTELKEQECARLTFTKLYEWENSWEMQGCQNEPATGATTGFFKVFAACKLLKRSAKKLKNRKRRRNCFHHDLHVPFCEAPSLPGNHISLVICVPPPRKHVSLVICVSLLVKPISLVICVPLTGKHTSLVISVFPPGKHISLVTYVPLLGNTYP